MRSGYVSLNLGYLRLAGRYGDYWSASGSAASNAYLLYFAPAGVYPSGGPDNRYNGFSLRCLPCFRMDVVVAVKENEFYSFSLPTATSTQQEQDVLMQ